MPITVAVRDILPAISRINLAVESKPLIPALADFLYEPGTDTAPGTLVSSDAQCEMQVPAPFSEDVAFTLPAKKLLDICNKLDASSALNLQIKKQRATIQCGNSTFVLQGQEPENFPRMSRLEDGRATATIAVDSQKLLQALKTTGIAAAKSDTRIFLNGVSLVCTPTALHMSGMNGYRLHHASLDAEIELSDQELHEPRMIIPAASVQKLSRWLKEGMVSLSFDESLLVVKTNEGIFKTLLIDAQYPDVKPLLTKACLPHPVVIPVPALREALSLADTINDDEEHRTRLHFDNDRLSISTTNAAHEAAVTEIGVPYPYPAPFTIHFNSKYLIDMLRCIEDDAIMMEFLSDGDGAKFHQKSEPHTIFLIMGIRDRNEH